MDKMKQYKCWNCGTVNEFELKTKRTTEIAFAGKRRSKVVEQTSTMYVMKCLRCGENNEVTVEAVI